ncbi:MAG: response regulator [Deltaproteobacteria bacterium]|nr:response regulator [Deltaproteobacteria bacterium]
MDPNKLLKGKKILIVDDEKDILDSLIELLDMCRIDTATSFEEGKRLLENEAYDVAILDIMGVQGFELLDIANKHEIPAIMLTAHALSEESLRRSAENGASYFAPKDEINSIDLFIADVLEAKEKKKNPWVKWFERLGGFYDKRFYGTNWREQEKKFWEEKLKKIPDY